MQPRVITQSAHYVESESGCSRAAIIAREQAVAEKNVRNSEELFPVVGYHHEILRSLIVAPVHRVLKIERRSVSRGEWKCLHGEKKHCIADTGGNLGETEDLKIPAHRTRTPRLVMVKTEGLRV